MMLLYLFERRPGLRITQSPRGGGWHEKRRTWCPAWDFQLLVDPLEVGEEFGIRARVIYKPYAGRDEIDDLAAAWQKALSDGEGDARVRGAISS